MNETSSGDYDESATRFGTRQPPLTTRLKRILSDYPPGAQILKELIQNADDAGAKNVGFLIDPRAHPSQNLLMPSLSELQGPALLAWNDAQFEKEDWQSIGKLDRSAKEGNVLKVGRFGIGFQSVHHITDVPVIISGPCLGILDPHTSFVSSKDDEEEPRTGKQFPLSDVARCPEQLAPFADVPHTFGYKPGDAVCNGTVFRFSFRLPVYKSTFYGRDLRSKISNKIYSCREAEDELFHTLCQELPHLLLFLKSVESVELYTWDKVKSAPKLFQKVSVDQRSLDRVRRFRTYCQDFCKKAQFATVLATCGVCITSAAGGQQLLNWMLCSTLGSSDQALVSLANELKVSLWSGVAAPLPVDVTVECKALHDLIKVSPQTDIMHHLKQKLVSVFKRTCADGSWTPPAEQRKGYPFCFLPLKDPTGLPVQVHGYFRVSSNRRSIEWPSQGDTSDQAKWNKRLVEESLVPTYAVLLAAKSCLFSYRVDSPEQVLCDPYSWWPIEQELRSSPVWSHILQRECLARYLCRLDLFWTAACGGRWIKASDCVLATTDTPRPIVDLLVSFDCNVVHLPSPISDTFDSLEGVTPLTKVSPDYVRTEMRKHPNIDLRKEKVLESVVNYITSDVLYDDDFSLLVDLPIVPVADVTCPPVTFTLHQNYGWQMQNSVEKIFFCDNRVQRLIPNLQSKMVAPSLPDRLQDLFSKIARTGKYTLVEATVAVVCPNLIAESMSKWVGTPPAGRVRWTPGQNGMPGVDWLQHLWKWLHDNDQPLSSLGSLPIVPVESLDKLSSCSGSAPLHLTSLQAQALRRDASGSIPDGIYEVAAKLECTLIEHSAIFDLHSQELSESLPRVTPKSLLQVLQDFPSVILVLNSFPADDKDLLRSFFFQAVPKAKGVLGRMRSLFATTSEELSPELAEFLKSLPIFAVGVGRTPVLHIALATTIWHSPDVIFPANDADFFPPDIEFPTNVLRVLTENRECYQELLAGETESLGPFISTRFGPLALSFQRDEKRKAFIWILKQYRSTNDQQISRFLKGAQFLPSVGNTLNVPNRLYDPTDQKLQAMFFDSQEKFPTTDFCSFLTELKSFGLQTYDSILQNPALFKEFILDRARAVSQAKRSSLDRAFQCSRLILSSLLEQTDLSILPSLRQISFLKCEVSRPIHYPEKLGWAGQNIRDAFYQPQSLCAFPNVDSLIHLVGSSCPLPASEYSDGISRMLRNKKRDFSNFFKSVKVNVISQHVKNVVLLPESSLRADGVYISDMMRRVYTYFNRNSSNVTQGDLHSKVWHSTENRFIPLLSIFKRSSIGVSLNPYIYVLRDIPNTLGFENVWDAVGMNDCPSSHDYCNVLLQIQSDLSSSMSTLSDSQVNMTVEILDLLSKDEAFRGQVLVPTVANSLLKPQECTFDDHKLSESNQDFLARKKDIVLTHSKVSRNIAAHFNVPSISSKLAKPKALKISKRPQTSTTFKGQEISLTRRISNIIKDYEDRIDVFKELIQNADDAGANEVKFLIDWRRHPTENLFTEEMRHWQGPALYAYNDSVFEDEDFSNICQVEGGTKLGDPTKIGRFGLGFCCTYHLTDVPSFVSRNQFVVLDPHLKYLGNVVPNQTGAMIDYVSEHEDMTTCYRDQLSPYQGVFGCNVLYPSVEDDQGFPHTLFRFPFRTIAAPRSDICGKTFDESSIAGWKQSFQTCGEKLLMFLRNVVKVELYELKEGEPVEAMQCLCSVSSNITMQRNSIDLVKDFRSSVMDHKPLCTTTGTKLKSIIVQTSRNVKNKPAKNVTKTSMWLISSSLGTRESLKKATTPHGRDHGLVPFTEVAVSMKKERSLYVPELCDGQVFCFLPLPIAIAQNCLINGYFDVSSNRRSLQHLQSGIWTEDTSKKLWNKHLIEDALSQTFVNMLLDIQWVNKYSGAPSRVLLEKYYSLWPSVHSQYDDMSGITTILKSAFVSLVCSHQHQQPPLFFTQPDTWCTSKAVTLLSKNFKQVFESVMQDVVEVASSVGGHQIALGVPDSITSELSHYVTVMEPIKYIEKVLLPNLNSIDVALRDRQILFVLKNFRTLSTDSYTALVRLLQCRECIPTEPAGTLQFPTFVVDRSSKLSMLFDEDEERFPRKELLKSEVIASTLRELGMSHDRLNDKDIIDRAHSIVRLLSRHDAAAARQRSDFLQRYFVGSNHSEHALPLSQLSAICFLPVLHRPEGTTVPWYRQTDSVNGVEVEDFRAAKDMFPSSLQHLVFTSATIADCSHPEMYNLFKFKSEPDVSLIIDNLNALQDWTSMQQNLAKADCIFLTQCTDHAYDTLNSMRSASVSCRELKGVWNEIDSFVDCSHLALKMSVSLAPHRLTEKDVPALRKNKPLWLNVGVKDQFTVEDCMEVLAEIKALGKPLNADTLSLVSGVLQHLYGKLTDEQKEKLLLPTTKDTLELCKRCYYDDRQWNEHKKGARLLEKYLLVHSRVVSQKLAEDFKVQPISDKIGNPKRLCIKYEEKGQRIPVERRINRILKEYKDNEDIFKELIQNADDAKATKVKFLIDWRQHPTESLLTPEMASLQGPALYAYNDSTFSDADFENICELEGATKKEDSSKIGRFGLGFCATYHLTEVPSFVSRSTVVFFDPQLKYLTKATDVPGLRFDFIGDEVDEIEAFYHDQLVPFQDVFNCQTLQTTEEYDGTLFRFPFRTASQARRSGISSYVCDDINTINRMKLSFENSLATLPVFLQHVKCVELYELHKGATKPSQMQLLFSVERDTCRSFSPLERFASQSQSIHAEPLSSTETFNVVTKKRVLPQPSPQSNRKGKAYAGKKSRKQLSSYDSNCTQWVLSSALGAPGTESWKYASQRKEGLVPLAEVAIPTRRQSMIPVPLEDGRSQLFCFLPLPIIIPNAPFLINGCFEMQSNRRALVDLEKGDRNAWNNLLIREVLVMAVQALLHFLTTAMPTSTDTTTWKDTLTQYYNIWPIHTDHPLTKMLCESFSLALQSCSIPLASCPFDCKKWMAVNEVTVFEKCFFGRVLYPINVSIMKVLVERGYKMCEFSHAVRQTFCKDLVTVITFSEYCSDVLLLEREEEEEEEEERCQLAKLRHQQLVHILKHFPTLKDTHEWLEDLLRTSDCIQVGPYGNRCRPTSLVFPDRHLRGLYSVEEERFPIRSLLQCQEIFRTLQILGMAVDRLTDEDMLDRARSIKSLEKLEAEQRCECFLNYLVSIHYRNHSERDGSNAVIEELKAVDFLPVQQRPEGTTVPWIGNESYYAPLKMVRSTCALETFTQLFVTADCVDASAQKLLSLTYPSTSVALDHFIDIVSWAKADQGSSLSEPDVKLLDKAMPAVYKCLYQRLNSESFLVTGTSGQSFRTILEQSFSDQIAPCIWQKADSCSRFLTPSQVVHSHQSSECYPYLVKLSENNEKFIQLFEILGVKQVYTLNQLVDVLQSIKEDLHGSPVSVSMIDFIVNVSHQIYNHRPALKYGLAPEEKEKYNKMWSELSFFLPNEKRVMYLAIDLAHKEDDAISSFPSVELSRSNIQYVHERVPKKEAKALGVRDLLSSIVSQFVENDYFEEMDFGQREELHTRLNNILDQYPADVSIFKEFIQNAEDASASEIVFVLDRRTFGETSLFADRVHWKSLQRTPSLLVFNNRKFTEKDIESITHLGVGGKAKEFDKIGRFGIGFNVSYHVTDCPTFVSYGEGGLAENFCMFDPNFRYSASKNIFHKNPGCRFKMKTVDGVNSSESFKDQFAPFLSDVIPKMAKEVGCFEDVLTQWPKGYTVFRLPLTRHGSSSISSKLSKGFKMNIEGIKKCLRDLKDQAASMLLFLNNLRRISVFEINKDGQTIKPWSVSVHLLEDGATKCCHFAAEVRSLSRGICSEHGFGQSVPPSISVAYNIELRVFKQSEQPGPSTNHVTRLRATASRHQPQSFQNTSVPSQSSDLQLLSEKWVICKRFGTSDIEERLLYFAGSNHLFPVAGVAVPVMSSSSQPFIGKIFTHLPLPLLSGIPAHVNGHFWIDQSRKHLESTGSGKMEPLKAWNEALTQNVVSQAYIEAVMKCKQIVLTGGKNSVEWFHHLLLMEGIRSTLQDFIFKDVFYQLLLEIEAQVLLSKRSELAPTPTWLAITANDKNPQKGWFFQGSNDVALVLQSLGVQLTAAPMALNTAVKSRKPRPPADMAKPSYNGKVEPGLARMYLRNCARLNRGVIVPALVSLLKYILEDITPDSCHEVNDLPLMLSADGDLHPISNNPSDSLFGAEFSELVSSGNVNRFFVSKRLLEDQKVKSKLEELGLIRIVTPSFVAQHINLPKQSSILLSSVDLTLLKRLWEYIIHMSRVCKLGINVLESFSKVAIIPTNQSTLVSVGSAKSVLREYGSVHLLKKLALPVVDFKQLGINSTQHGKRLTDLVRPLLAHESERDDVLHVLKAAVENRHASTATKISRDDVDAFIAFVKAANDLHCYRDTLRSLSIYKTITREWKPLQGHSTVYAFPGELPVDGMERIHSTRAMIVRINHSSCNFYNAVGVTILAAVEFYQKVVLPSFSDLSTQSMKAHLTYIVGCQSSTLTGSDSNPWHVVQQKVASIPFILDERIRQMKRATEYYNPNESLLKAFLTETQFPPPSWGTPTDLILLTKIGLNMTVTDQQWISFARTIASESLPSDEALYKATLLLSSLKRRIQSLSLPVELQTTSTDTIGKLKVLLGKISGIPFVPQILPPEMSSLFENLSVPEDHIPKFVQLRGSFLCESSQIPLVCIANSHPYVCKDELIPAEYFFGKSLLTRQVCQVTEMRQLSSQDVCKNLLKLSKLANQFTLSSVGNLVLTEELQDVFKQHYDFLRQNGLPEVKALLYDRNCLFLPSKFENTFYISKGTSIVRLHKADRPYNDYLPCIPEYLNTSEYKLFLSSIGVEESITDKHMILFLNKLFDAHIELNPNLKNAVIAIYEELVNNLRSRQCPDSVVAYIKGLPFVPLPDESQTKLYRSTDLVLNDAQLLKDRIAECSQFHFICPPPSLYPGERPTLPACLKVQSLGDLIYTELDRPVVLDRDNRCKADLRTELLQQDSESDSVVDVCPFAGPFVNFLQSEEFGNGLRRMMSHKLNGKQLTEEHEECIEEVQNLCVRCVYGIRTTLKNTKTGRIIADSEDIDVPCYLDSQESPKCLYVTFHYRNSCCSDDDMLISLVVKELVSLLRNQVDSSMLESILKLCNPAVVDSKLSRLGVKPYTRQNDNVDSRVCAGGLGKGTTIDNYEYILTCNFSCGELVKYCKANSETVEARVVEIPEDEDRSSNQDTGTASYPYPLTLSIKVEEKGDPSVLTMSSLLVCKYLPQQEGAQLRRLYGVTCQDTPAADLTKEKSIVLELPSGNYLQSYLAKVLSSILRSFSKEQVYFSIERLLFQLHFDCVHRHNKPETFQDIACGTFLNVIRRHLPQPDHADFLSALSGKIQAMITSEDCSVDMEDDDDDMQPPTAIYSRVSSWSMLRPPQSVAMQAASTGVSVPSGHHSGSTFNGVTVPPPPVVPTRSRQRGGRHTANFPMNPGPARVIGGGAYIWGSGATSGTQVFPSPTVETPPDPSPTQSLRDAQVWVADARDTLEIVTHLSHELSEASVVGQDGEESNVQVYSFPAAVCFYAHEIVLKCLKALFFAYCGLPGQLQSCKNLVELHQQLLSSGGIPEEVKDLEPFVHLVSGHGWSCCCTPSFDPPRTTSDTHSPHVAREVLRAATAFLTGIQCLPLMLEYFDAPIPANPQEQVVQGRPPSWEGTDLLMPMNPSSMEYQEVRRLFDATMPGATIRNIERVQNLDLWNRYCDCRRRMQTHLPSAGEKKLFHGTRRNSPKLVYGSDAGFDLRHSSVGMWGLGSYFAVNASYSHGYAYSGSANRQMFVAKVLTGSCVRLPPNRDLKFPPERQDPQQAGIRRRHNSVQGFTNGSEVYIIYDNAQSYPAYLISYSM